MLHELTGMSKARAAHELRFNTTHQAYVNLIEKKADLILVAGPSDEELRLAKSRGIQMRLTPIGWDAFIFLAHQDNPVKGLSSEQVRRIYEGAIHNWNEVGARISRSLLISEKKIQAVRHTCKESDGRP